MNKPPPINPHFWAKAKQAERNFMRLFRFRTGRQNNAHNRRRCLYWARQMDHWLIKAIATHPVGRRIHSRKYENGCGDLS